MIRPRVTVVPKSGRPAQGTPPTADHDGDGHVAQGFQRGARALVKATARMLASRLAALVRRKSSMLAPPRLKACTSRTPAMLSCSSALTLPISRGSGGRPCAPGRRTRGWP